MFIMFVISGQTIRAWSRGVFVRRRSYGIGLNNVKSRCVELSVTIMTFSYERPVGVHNDDGSELNVFGLRNKPNVSVRCRILFRDDDLFASIKVFDTVKYLFYCFRSFLLPARFKLDKSF